MSSCVRYKWPQPYKCCVGCQAVRAGPAVGTTLVQGLSATPRHSSTQVHFSHLSVSVSQIAHDTWNLRLSWCKKKKKMLSTQYFIRSTHSMNFLNISCMYLGPWHNSLLPLSHTHNGPSTMTSLQALGGIRPHFDLKRQEQGQRILPLEQVINCFLSVPACSGRSRFKKGPGTNGSNVIIALIIPYLKVAYKCLLL